MSPLRNGHSVSHTPTGWRSSTVGFVAHILTVDRVGAVLSEFAYLLVCFRS